MAASGADAVARIGWDNTDARKGADEFVNIAKRTRERSEAHLSSIGTGIKFASAFAGLNSAQNVVEKGLDGLKRGFNFNTELNNASTGIGNVLRRFDGLNKTAAKNETARALERIIELEPKTAGTLQTLTGGFMGTLAAAKGIGLTTAQNVELVAKFANAIANAGLPLDQIRQEFRSILTSTITKDSQVAKILGITNEDMNAMRGNGDAIFAYLTTKLGEFGEAGDSAQVTFSSLDSSIDKALGATTVPLFNLAIKAAKQLAAQLENPAWVADMQAAGVDIAKTAESLMEIGKVVIAWLPRVTRLTAAFTGMAPSLIAIAAAYTAMRIKERIADKVALTKATQTATAAVMAETSAVQANTQAQTANANASKSKGPRTITNASGKSLSVQDGAQFGSVLLGIPQQAGQAGQKAAQSFKQSFLTSMKALPQSAGAQFISSFNGMVPLIMASTATAFLDRSKGVGGRIGGSMGTATVDGLSFALSAMGPKGALAGFGLQMIDASFALGTQMGEAMAESMAKGAFHPEVFASAARGGTKSIRDLLDKGKTDEAKKKLDSQLAVAKSARGKASWDGDGAMIDNEIMTLEQMQQNWDQWVASSAIVRRQTQEAAELAKEAAAAQAAKDQEMNEKRLEAWKQVLELSGSISDQKIAMLPDDQQIAALQAKLKRVFAESGMGATLNQDVKAPDGSTMFRDRVNQAGQVNSIGGMEKLAALQRKQGDPIGAAKTLERLKEAQAIQQRINEAGAKQAEKKADAGKSAEELAYKREIFALEGLIQGAIARKGTTESSIVKALQDQLAAKQLAKELQDTLNFSSQEALKLAQQRVAMERAAADAKANSERQKQQGQAASELYAELMILRAQSEGRDQLAAQMQREIDARREARRIAEETGMSEERALQIAREKLRLQEQANTRQSSAPTAADSRYDAEGRRLSDGRKKIDASIEPGDRNSHLYGDGEKSGQAMRDDARAHVDAQKAKFQEGLYTPAGRDRPEVNPLNQKAAQNAADARTPGNETAQTATDVVNLIKEILSTLTGGA